MRVLPIRPILIRARFLRFALALLAIVQFAMLVVVTADSANEARSAAAHFEPPGGRKHYVHDETRCIVCVAHQQGSVAPRAIGIVIVQVDQHRPPTEARARIDQSTGFTPAAPRAPPVVASL